MRLEALLIPYGDLQISALRYIPESNARTTSLIYVHGFTSGKYSLDSLASYLAHNGYPGTTFDCIGHKLGGTGGEMHSAEQAAENLRAVLRYVEGQPGVERIVLVGHSMGAAACIKTAAWELEASDIEESHKCSVAGVVCICAGRGAINGFSLPAGRAMVEQRKDYVAGTPALMLLSQIDALLDSAKSLKNLPSLFIAAGKDVLLPVARVRALAEEAGGEFLEIDSSHLEAPDRSRTQLLRWLKSRDW